MNERSRSYMVNEELYKNSCQNLGKFLDRYSQGPMEKRREKFYQGFRERRIQNNSDSILTLIPDHYDRGHKILSRTTRILLGKGIETKQDLLMVRADDLTKIRGVGEKTVELVGMMQEVALAEFHLQWSK